MDIEITHAEFADAVEAQHELLMADTPEAAMLRSFFSPEFLAEKDAETKEYVRKLREVEE